MVKVFHAQLCLAARRPHFAHLSRQAAWRAATQSTSNPSRQAVDPWFAAMARTSTFENRGQMTWLAVVVQMDQQSSENVQQFSRLLVANQRRIYGFILSLVHDRAAANDILQDVSALLWEKFDRFEIGTDFAAWGMSVARLTILNWRRRQDRLALSLDDEEFSLLADEAVTVSCEFEERRIALGQCLEGLSAENRDLIAQRYEMNRPVSQIADRLGRSRVAVHRRLNRIYSLLLDCINAHLEVGNRT